MKTIIISLLSIILFSCNSSDCTNGIQDGNETGVDCGGNCPNCTTPAPSNNIAGDWTFQDSRMVKVDVNGVETVTSQQGSWWGYQLHTHRFQSGTLSLFMTSVGVSTLTAIATYNSSSFTVTQNSIVYDFLSVTSNQMIFQRFIGYDGATQTTTYERTTLIR